MRIALMKSDVVKDRAEKEKKQNESGTKMGPVKRWMLRIFYTAFLVIGVYVMVMAVTVMIPSFVSFLVKGLGLSLGNYSEIIGVLLGGLFFTAWAFVITYGIGRKIWKTYVSSIKKTMSEETLAKWREFNESKDTSLEK